MKLAFNSEWFKGNPTLSHRYSLTIGRLFDGPFTSERLERVLEDAARLQGDLWNLGLVNAYDALEEAMFSAADREAEDDSGQLARRAEALAPSVVNNAAPPPVRVEFKMGEIELAVEASSVGELIALLEELGFDPEDVF